MFDASKARRRAYYGMRLADGRMGAFRYRRRTSVDYADLVGTMADYRIAAAIATGIPPESIDRNGGYS